MSPLFLYVLLKLDTVIAMSWALLYPIAGVFYVSIALWLISWIAQSWVRSTDEYSEPNPKDIADTDAWAKSLRKRARGLFFWMLPFYLILSAARMLIPTTKEMAIIYVVPKILNNKAVTEMPGKLLNLSSEWVEELRPANVKKDAGAIVDKIKEPAK